MSLREPILTNLLPIIAAYFIRSIRRVYPWVRLFLIAAPILRKLDLDHHTSKQTVLIPAQEQIGARTVDADESRRMDEMNRRRAGGAHSRLERESAPAASDHALRAQAARSVIETGEGTATDRSCVRTSPI